MRLWRGDDFIEEAFKVNLGSENNFYGHPGAGRVAEEVPQQTPMSLSP